MAEEATIRIVSPSGGISRQPAHLRFQNQVQAASNVSFRVASGASKRPGTRYVKRVTGLTTGQSYRLHPINRSTSEKYLVVYGNSSTPTFRVFTTAGTEAVLFQSGVSKAYIATSSPTADDFRMATLADTTIITNQNCATGYLTSPAYSVARTVRDYDVLFGYTPASGAYAKTSLDRDGIAAGHWRYNPGANTYAKIQFAAGNSSLNVTSGWTVASQNPMGFKIFMVRFPSALSGITYTHNGGGSASTIAHASFSSYTFAAGDKVNITGGTGATTGAYEIAGQSGTTLTLKTAPGTGNQVDFTCDGIGDQYDVIANFLNESVSSMDDIARVWQRLLREAGATNSSVNWTPGLLGATGYMTITHTHAGTKATFPATTATRAPSAGRNQTDSSTWTPGAFVPGTATITAGGGNPGPTTNSPASRWTRVPAPSQVKSILNRQTMPQRLVRLSPAGAYSGGYTRFTTDLKPAAYWRLGETSGTVAGDEVGGFHGTYVASPTLGATGALNSDTNTAATFNGTTQYVTLPVTNDFMYEMEDGVTLEFWIKCTGTAIGTILQVGDATSGYIRIKGNADGAAGTTNTSGAMHIAVVDKAGNSLTGYSTAGAAAFRNGSYHHIAVATTPSSGALALYLDGAAVSLTTAGSATGGFTYASTVSTLCAQVTQAVVASLFFAATIDELAFHIGAFDATFAAARYNTGANASYSHNPIFAMLPCEWGHRLSGDDSTNPLPTIVDGGYKISDVAFFRERLVLGGRDRLNISGSDDYFNLFLDNHLSLGDFDPIDVGLTGARVAAIDFLVPVRRVLGIFASGGVQYELSGEETLTARTVAITQTTNRAALSVRPTLIDGLAYFPCTQSGITDLYEYGYDDQQAASNALSVSYHVPGLLPTSIRTVASCGDRSTVVALGADSALYIYRFFYSGGRKEQSAWSTYAYDGTYTVRDIAVIENSAYMLVESQSQHVIEYQPLDEPAATSGFPFDVTLDRQMSVVGSYGAPTTTWTLPDSLSDTTITRAVLGTGTPTGTAGDTLTLTANGTTSTITGNYGTAAAILGRPVAFSMTLSRQYARDVNGQADLNAHIAYRELIVEHVSSGAYTVRQAMTGRSDKSKSYVVPSGYTDTSRLRFFAQGSADLITLYIESSAATPLTIAGLQFQLDYVRRSL